MIANGACLKQAIRDCGQQRIQLAWLWLQHQPQSALALWFKRRVNRNGGRLKKTTIVALARKLLVALWKKICGCRRRHRGCRCEERLKGDQEED